MTGPRKRRTWPWIVVGLAFAFCAVGVVAAVMAGPEPRRAAAPVVEPTRPADAKASAKPAQKPAATDVRRYRNCTAMRRDHPNGVPRTHPAYRRSLDRDRDGQACEIN